MVLVSPGNKLFYRRTMRAKYIWRYNLIRGMQSTIVSTDLPESVLLNGITFPRYALGLVIRYKTSYKLYFYLFVMLPTSGWIPRRRICPTAVSGVYVEICLFYLIFSYFSSSCVWVGAVVVDVCELATYESV